MTAIEVALLLIGVVFILGSFFIMEKLSPTELSRVAELSEDELRMVMDRELEITGAKISDMADQAVDLSMSQIQRKMEKDTNEKIMAISEYSDVVMEKLQKFNNEVTFLYSMLGDKHTELNECMEQLNDLILACQTVRVQPASVRMQPETVRVQQAVVRTQPEMTQVQQAAVRTQPETVRMQSEALQVQPAAAVRQYQEPPAAPLKDDGATEPDQIFDEMDEAKQPEAPAASSVPETAETENEAGSTNVREKILERYRDGEDLKDIARDLGLGYGEVKLIVELYKGEENQ